MSEFDEYFDETFFIIDSNNLNDVGPRFQGYTFINNKIVHDDYLITEDSINGCGSYLFIDSNKEFIKIFQDFNGSYGLYFYQIGDYFAISNSFFKLVEYLTANDLGLSLNKEFAEAFLFADLCSYAYCETLVNEITLLPKNYKVIIDKSSKEIVFEEIDYGEDSVSIDSKEGVAILDSWYYRWVELIRSIKSKTNNLSFDLSGGMDSRIIAALWLTANIDLSKVRIKSHMDNLHVHKEDYHIASKIGDAFDFELNNPSFSYTNDYFKDILTPIDISFYTKLGFHKQMYYKFYKSSEKVYTITGDGGECIRGYPNQSFNDYLNYIIRYCHNQDSLINSTTDVVKRAWSKLINKRHLNEDSERLSNIHYREVRSRHHFGKASVESYFANWITLTPLLDPDLYKLNFSELSCKDPSLLFALIFVRYCPELLEFEFEGGRRIASDTIEYAKKLNEKYQFIPKEYDFIAGPQINKVNDINCSSLSKDDLEEMLMKVYFSDLFENEFNDLFSKIDYTTISNIIEKQKFHPLRHVFAAISSIFVKNLISMKNKDINYLISMYLEDYDDSFISKSTEFKLLKYNTIRMDVKSFGENNSVEIINNSDIYSNLSNPDWFKRKDGVGFILKSFKGVLDLEIKCVNSDKIKIAFRSPHVKDKDGNNFPVYIDYNKIAVNDDIVLDSNKLVWHNEPIFFEKDIGNSHSIKIHVEWNPFSKDSHYKNVFEEKYIMLEKENKELKKKYKMLEKENKKLNKKLEAVFDSNSWKLTSIFRRVLSILKNK